MPELPEVQTTANSLNKLIKGLIIKDVWTDYGGTFHNGKNHIKNRKYFPIFRDTAIGQKIATVGRRGKNVLINLSKGDTILVHMKMTGHLLYGRYEKDGFAWEAVGEGPLRDDPFNRFIHLVFRLSNGKHLALSDMRKFAKVCIIKTSELSQSDDLKNLGPDALDKSFSEKKFRERLALRLNGKIKQVIMDQTIIAGIGNIYSDEALWLSNIHPLSTISKITNALVTKLYTVIQTVLRKGIDFGGDSMSDYRAPDGERGLFQLHHKAYGRKGEDCPKKSCHGKIARIKIGGRSAHFCDTHQKLFK